MSFDRAFRRRAKHRAPPRQTPETRSGTLFKYLWPFWYFKDASRGDLYARAAAYRHNREMRVYLPGYLRRWSIGTVLTFAIARQLAAWSSSQASLMPDAFLIMAAAIGMLFATEVCLLLVTAYVYWYLSRHVYLS